MDRLLVELPAPKNSSPNDAAAIQELLGGKYGEVSTLMNYTFQSFACTGIALLLSLLGLLLGGVTSWLGGELIERLGISVDPGAHPNAPNSLSGRPAGSPST